MLFRSGFARRNEGGDAVAAEKGDMNGQSADEQSRQHASVHRKEAGQGVMSVGRAADRKLLHFFTYPRRQCHEICCDIRGPKSLLIPRQQIAGEAKPHDQHHQDEANPIVELARRPIGAIPNHLKQVQDHDHDHGLSHEVMQAAKEPAASHLVLDVIDAFVGGLAAGAVSHPQEDAGDRLGGEGKHEHAARDIAKPSAAWNALIQQIVSQLALTGAVVEPIEKRLYH